MWKPGQIVTIPVHGENTKWRVMNIDLCIERTNTICPDSDSFAITVLMDIFRNVYPTVKENLSQSDMICPLEAYPKTK